MFATRVTRLKRGPFKTVLAWFDVQFGDVEDGTFTPLFVAPGFALKAKNDGGYFYQAPAKKRLKDGEPVKVNGYDKWDPYVDLALEKQGEEWKPSKAAFNARKALLEQAVKAYDAAEDKEEGRGSQPKAQAAAKGKGGKDGAQTQINEPEANGFLDEEDDDLPF